MLLLCTSSELDICVWERNELKNTHRVERRDSIPNLKLKLQYNVLTTWC